MKFLVILPTEVALEREVDKVVAVGDIGSFCLLPNHRDVVAALVPGIVTFAEDSEPESHLAVDGGVLVKQGQEVRIATSRAVLGPALGDLRAAVERDFRSLTDAEKEARVAVERLEGGLVRHVLDWEGVSHA